jgi:hypothetical protein
MKEQETRLILHEHDNNDDDDNDDDDDDVYEMVERRSRTVPQGNLIDQQEAEIQM